MEANSTIGQKANPLILFSLIVFINVLLACPAQAQIYEYRTNDLRLIYVGKGYSYMIPHCARTFENAMNFHKKFWNYTPTEPVSILLNDFTDIGNGGTMTIPWNFISVAIAPFEYTFDVMPANERMQWLMSHELTHTVMTDKAAGADNIYRSIFSGKVMPEAENPISMAYSYLTTPRWYSPRWFHEGIAVFMETWMSGGLGRTLGGYDEMVFRTMVRDSAYFYRVVGLETEGTTIDFQVGVNSYLYGTRFVSHLASRYGVGKLKDFYSRSTGSGRFYAGQFEKIYGLSVEDEWENWIEEEKGFQQKNLELIRKNPVTRIQKIIPLPLGSVSKTYFDKKERKIYAAVNYPGRLSHICSINIDNGANERIAGVESPGLYYVTSLAFDDSAGVLFASTHNNNWRGLESINAKTHERRNLIDITRAGDLAFNKKDRSLWGIQGLNGRTTVVRFEPPYENFMEVYTVPFGQSLFDIEISPDGKLLSGTLSGVTGKQQLVVFKTDSLMAGLTRYEKIYEFEDNAASNFIFSGNGKYMYGTSYYTGVSNVFRIELASKKLDILTNSETGLFRPVEISDDTLLVYEYLQNGLLPGTIKIAPVEDVSSINYFGQEVIEKNREVESWMLPPPSKINIDSLKLYERDYNELTELKAAYLYPEVEGYKDFPSYGVRFRLMDVVGIHALGMSMSYSPNKLLPVKERVHASLDYNYWDLNIRATYNYADFYDLFGPTKLSRAGYSYSARYHHLILFNKPDHLSYALQASAYGDLERLPDYQNVAVSFDKLYSAAANLTYSYLRKSLGAVEDEEGFEWKINAQDNLVAGKNYPRIFNNFDIGFLLPARNMSLWLRTSAGHCFGNREEAFNNFYFGGFGNNYVDHLSSHRYRDAESFPGLEINEAAGRNYAKLTAEINLPAVRFRRLGFLYFYSTFARVSVFGSGLVTNMEESLLRKEYYSTGLQVDLELVLFSQLKSTLSAGYGRAAAKERHPANEFMISLKIM